VECFIQRALLTFHSFNPKIHWAISPLQLSGLG
jgi:hypothetical protein